MAISTSADPETGWVHVRATGDVSAGEVAEHLKDLDARGLYARPRLVDARGCMIAMSRDELTRIVLLVRQLQMRSGMSSVALVAPDDATYDLIQTNPGFGASSDPVIQVFRNPEDATDWLRHRHPGEQPPA